MPVSHFIELPHQSFKIALVCDMMVEIVVSPHPTGEAERD